MPHALALLCLALACLLPLGSEAAAQSHLPVSTEISVGFRVGHGGTYVNRGGAALDLVLGYRLGESPAGTLIGALTLGAQTPVTSTLQCLGVESGCAPEFPAFVSGGALLGVQRGSARTFSARALAGPVYHLSNHDAQALGVQGRVDVSTPPWRHTAVVASLRHAALPSFRGEPLGMTSFGVGIRIQ
jgi:hypothetical protein